MNLKIYTKTGDKGETGLFGGQRVSKSSIRVDAYGEVDELNAFLGLARCYCQDKEISEILGEIQEDLFAIGADLATPPTSKTRAIRISLEAASRLEGIIDKLDATLSPLKRFILPGGGKATAHIHAARGICRRAERRIVELSKTEEVNPAVLVYMNRLSDLLFIVARHLNKIENISEKEWKGQG